MNENIGELGLAFIAQRTELGIDFDKAWAEWCRLSAGLRFVLVECPEVRYYDDWRVCDRDERLRIRRLAHQKIGRGIRSQDISALAKAAEGLDVERALRPYHMDRDLLRELYRAIADWWEATDGYTEEVGCFRQEIADDAAIETHAHEIEQFAMEHSLWAVPPEKLVHLFFNHQIRIHPGAE